MHLHDSFIRNWSCPFHLADNFMWKVVMGFGVPVTGGVEGCLGFGGFHNSMEGCGGFTDSMTGWNVVVCFGGFGAVLKVCFG